MPWRYYFYGQKRAEYAFTVHRFYVVLAGLIADISASEGLPCLSVSLSCLGAECINTAFEYLCDALHPQWSAMIGKVKDTAAARQFLFAARPGAVGI
jgi:diacylglycerol kinase